MSVSTARAGDLDARARQSLGISGEAIYRAAAAVLADRGAAGTIADIGCGTGNLRRYLGAAFTRCIGVDAVQYEGLPGDVEFVAADLDRLPLPLPDWAVDVAAAVEVVEHLENPRAFCRELVRITRPGGWVVVTTPNQLSVLSLLTLITRRRFSAFQDASYPAHLTALLEIDLRRIAAETGLEAVEVRYTGEGRMPGSARHYPAAVSARFPRGLSDNVVLIGRTRG
ncbi:MAG: methyltransferase domain-containing protein [Acidobacteriota bacterium]